MAHKFIESYIEYKPREIIRHNLTGNFFEVISCHKKFKREGIYITVVKKLPFWQNLGWKIRDWWNNLSITVYY